MLIPISRFMLTGILSFLILFIVVPDVSADECFSSSYSVQQGRGIFDEVIPRDLEDGEYQDLQELFRGLVGEWEGEAEKLVCEGTEDDVRKEIDNYSIESEGKMRSSGQLTLKTTLSSRKKKTRQHQNLRFYLDQEKLATEPNIAVADIELISVSTDELAYVKKSRRRSPSGAPFVHETITRISKTAEASFMVEKLLYIQGRLIVISTWHLERK